MATARDKRAEGPDHPYLDWALQTDFAYLRPGDWLPLLVEFRRDKVSRDGPSLVESFSRLQWLAPRTTDVNKDEWIKVPSLFTLLANTVPGLQSLPLSVVLIRRRHARAVLTDAGWKDTIVRAELGPPLYLPQKPSMNAYGPTNATLDQAGPGTLGSRAVIGVIDQGIAFAHARFRNANGSRIAYLWQQDTGPDDQSPFGTEIRAHEIDQALNDARGDEEAVYRAKGALAFGADGYKALARRRTHGTQVLDLAAGADIAEDVTDRPIIAVDMPEQAIGDPAGSTLTPNALLALVYIYLRARSLASSASNERLPVIVNISYGPHEGPHDGSSLFERYADQLIEWSTNTRTPLRIVLAAGNSRQSRVHAACTIAKGATRTLRWRLQPAGRTPSALELWWPKGIDLSVRLRSPNGTVVEVSAATPQSHFPAATPVLFSASYQAPPQSARTRVVLFVAPTDLDPKVPGGHPIAPSGTWEVQIRNEGNADAEVKAWIKRGDTPQGRRAKGRQSHFEDADYRRFDDYTRPVLYDRDTSAAVRRLGTLSGIATGRHTTVVGGYRESDGQPAPYSSAGAHDNPQRPDPSPSLLALSDRSVVRRGVLATGTRSGTVATISGTSAAAPEVTRWLADEWIKQRKEPDVATTLAAQEPPAQLPAPVATVPNDAPSAAELPLLTGHGKLAKRHQKRPA